MYKFLLFFLVATWCLLLSYCKNGEGEKSHLQSRSVADNDTTCYSCYISDEFSHSIKWCKACHIVYGDSMSTKRQKQFASSELSREYNFDNFQQPLYYTLKGDTINLKILFLIRQRQEIKPDTLFIKGDTIFLNEKRFSKNVAPSGFEMEELSYELIVSENFKPIIKYYK